MRVWLPYSPEGPLAGLPEPLQVDVYDGNAPPPPSIADVVFYVAPYEFGTESLELTARMPELRVLQTLTAGVEHAQPYVPDGVTLCNARGVHDASTAELATALMLASLRGLPEFVRAQDRRDWTHARHDSLADRTVLLIGYGSVGAAVERRLEPFECDVLRVASRARDGVFGAESLAELLPRADVVVLTVPLSEHTRRMADADFLSAMRDGALLVNVSRGGVVDTDALIAECASGRLRAALDVIDPEPPPADHPIWTTPGVLMTPHVGGNSSAFLPRAMQLIREQLERYVSRQPLLNVVSGPQQS